MGLPFFPGIEGDNVMSNLNTLSMMSINIYARNKWGYVDEIDNKIKRDKIYVNERGGSYLSYTSKQGA